MPILQLKLNRTKKASKSLCGVITGENRRPTSFGNRIGLIQQTKGYRGHNLYLETVAETGLIGLLSLLAIIFVVMRGLWREHERLAQRCPELNYMASVFPFAACAISAVFAHLSDQRYFWLLVAVSSAAVRIIHQDSQERPWRDLALRPNETDYPDPVCRPGLREWRTF